MNFIFVGLKTNKMVNFLESALLVVFPVVPLLVHCAGISTEVVALVYYSHHGYQQEFYITLTFMLLPSVVLLVATLSGIEKSKCDDPDTIKNHVILRAVYYASQVKMFHVYLYATVAAIRKWGKTSVGKPCGEGNEGHMIRRYQAFVGMGPQLIYQLNILCTKIINEGSTVGDHFPLTYVVVTLVLSLSCSLTVHSLTDSSAAFEEWTPVKAFTAMSLVYTWKILLVTARGLSVALFIYQFGAFIMIPVFLHGIIVFIIFIICSKPNLNGFWEIIKTLIICYCQMFDINDVYRNEVSGKITIQIVYYVFKIAGDFCLIVPFYFLNWCDSVKMVSMVIVGVGNAGAVPLRILYYSLFHPFKESENVI